MPSEFKGPTGFDVGQAQIAIVSAVSVRREQLAKSNCKRQHVAHPGCGLSGVGPQGARVAYRRKHTSSAETLPRVAAQIQRMVEAPTPWCQRHPIALKSDTHVSERAVVRLADPRSIRGGSTGLCGLSPDASPFKSVRRRCEVVASRSVVSRSTNHVTGGESAAPSLVANRSLRTTIRKADHRPNGGDEATRRPVWRSLVARCGNAEVARSNRVTGPHPTQLSKRVVSAQLEESACRRASETYCVSGSTAGLGGTVAQPEFSSRRRAA